MAMQERTSETRHAVREHAATLVQSIIEQAAARALTSAGRAREVGTSLASGAKEKVGPVPHRVGEEVVPSLREVALHAASAALELWQAARERAAEAAEAAQEEVAEPVAHLVEAAERRARAASHLIADRVEAAEKLAREASQTLAERVDAAERRAKGASHAVVERAEHVGERAREASAHAAEATVSTGRNAGALLFWAGAATGVIFYVMLSRERREQLLRLADSIVGQAREILRDIQGYDEEFA